jgi:tRNA(Ile)-lysidine synthase
MTRTLAQALQDFQPGLPLAVAYSGGADSTALLLACAERWPGQVSAIHIHHGLQTAADGFELHCREVCARLGVPLQVQRVDARPAPGQSPEEAARSARYNALRQCAEAHDPPIRHIALAQHADDQVETLLLALSRGAGLPGLSAMPMRWERDGICYYRPLLEVSGADLRLGLRERGASWIEDPTNADEQYTRNRIRARLLPALEETFPQFRDTFARSAAHAAQAQRLLDELAAEDLARVGVPPQILALQGLSRERQANVLRAWLRGSHVTAPSTAQLQELLDQVGACTTRGHRIHLKVGSGFVQRQGPVLTWYNP